jgi:RNA polymerase sigma-70 factor (ECF subfamily)
MHNRLSDEALMLRYKDGDLPAFQELYRRHSRGLYRFLSWHAPRREWADEIAQDSWIKLHQARQHYQPLASFRTYLYQIARNRLLDLLRQPQAQLVDDEALFDHLSDSGTAASASVGADAALEARQRTRALHAAIHALPGEQKEALILQQFSGMSLEEIADLVAVPVETVKSRLRYAMKKLRQHYAADADKEPV